MDDIILILLTIFIFFFLVKQATFFLAGFIFLTATISVNECVFLGVTTHMLCIADVREADYRRICSIFCL